MTAEATAWLAAGAALAGSVIGATAVLLSDWFRWRRERRVRWETDRRQTYVALLDGYNTFRLDAVYLRRFAGERRAEAIQRISTAVDQSTTSFHAIEITAPPAVRQAAAALRSSVELIADVAITKEYSQADMDRAVEAYKKAISAFIMEARRDVAPETLEAPEKHPGDHEGPDRRW